MILAIDPGNDKTGIAIYDPSTHTVIKHQVVATKQFVDFIKHDKEEYLFHTVVIGDGTRSKQFQQQVQKLLPEVTLVVIDEAFSTLEARQLYFQLEPPKGWKRFLPVSMQTPGRQVDDLVAIILLQRYLGDMPKIGR